VVERDKWISYSITRATGAEQIGLSTDKSAVLEHIQVVANIGRLSTNVIGNATSGVIPVSHCRKDRLVQRRVSDLGYILFQ
jgi:hypothetical protein